MSARAVSNAVRGRRAAESRSTIVSRLNVLSELGELPAKALERPDAIEDFRQDLCVQNRLTMARPARIELATPRLGGGCSIP